MKYFLNFSYLLGSLSVTVEKFLPWSPPKSLGDVKSWIFEKSICYNLMSIFVKIYHFCILFSSKHDNYKVLKIFTHFLWCLIAFSQKLVPFAWLSQKFLFQNSLKGSRQANPWFLRKSTYRIVFSFYHFVWKLRHVFCFKYYN